MREIDDDEMRRTLTETRPYTVVLLHPGPEFGSPGARAIIWEHGRRNMQLRDAGILSIVLPVRDGGDLSGVGVFGAGVEETTAIMAGDPAVAAGVLVAEVHAASGFLGSTLPDVAPEGS
ncbi:hypothetical protein HII28_09965 [Planctomonas sp. JC2975]|nr:hypothetical protein [Planctomonas sp. JC2975]